MSGPARTHWPSRRVLAGDRAWSFDLDCRTGAVVVALDDGPVRLRSLRWSEKVTLARFAALGPDLVDEQLLRLAVEGDAPPPAGDARDALLALVAWLEAPAGDALALRPELMATVTLDVCGAIGIRPSELDDRDAADVAALWRAAGASSSERGRAGAGAPPALASPVMASDDGQWTRIEFVPDPEPDPDASDPAAQAVDSAGDGPPADEQRPEPDTVVAGAARRHDGVAPATDAPVPLAGAGQRSRMAFVLGLEADAHAGGDAPAPAADPASRSDAPAQPAAVAEDGDDDVARPILRAPATRRDPAAAPQQHPAQPRARHRGGPSRAVIAERPEIAVVRLPGVAPQAAVASTHAGAAQASGNDSPRRDRDPITRGEIAPALTPDTMAPPAPAASGQAAWTAPAAPPETIDVDDLLDELGDRLARAAADLGIAER